MSRFKVALLGLGGVALLTFGAVSCVLPAPAPKPPANGHRDFVVSGSVENLRPGGSRPMVLTVRNPNSVAISVRSVTVAAGAAGPSCPASALTLPRWTGRLTVPKRGTATLSVDVALEATAPDACQDARWPLTFGGSAVKA
jgi:hypothetical protein